MLKGALLEILGLTHLSGWINVEIFAKAMNYCIRFMKVSKNNSVLLLMNNYVIHLSIDAIEMAKENEMSILAFPTHCSHKLQPLDIGVYGSFKRHCFFLCNLFMTCNPGTFNL